MRPGLVRCHQPGFAHTVTAPKEEYERAKEPVQQQGRSQGAPEHPLLLLGWAGCAWHMDGLEKVFEQLLILSDFLFLLHPSGSALWQSLRPSEDKT